MILPPRAQAKRVVDNPTFGQPATAPRMLLIQSRDDPSTGSGSS